MPTRTGTQARAGGVLFHLAVGISSFVMVYPILWLVASSFKGYSELWLRIYSIVPRTPTLANYINGWRGFGGVSFATFYKNSVVLSALGTLFAILSSAIVAYGFARLEFRGRSILFACMLGSLMIPQQVQLIPQYVIFSKLGLVNTFHPLLLPRLFGQAFFIFMFVQFFRGIPRELDEAAAIDGNGHFGTFSRVLLPLLKPALFTASIFSFYWTWGEFLQPLVYLNNPKKYTVSVALRSFSDPAGMTDWGAIFAMSTLSLVPVFLVFVVFQRSVVEGIATTGLKR